jgi:hypothetical protein
MFNLLAKAKSKLEKAFFEKQYRIIKKLARD